MSSSWWKWPASLPCLAVAKLAQLVLDRGVWHGERVVSEDGLALCTAAQVQSDSEYAGGVFPYGYYWWLVPEVGFSAWGHGGQFVLVVPDRRLVVVQTAFPDTDFDDSDLNAFLALMRPLL